MFITITKSEIDQLYKLSERFPFDRMIELERNENDKISVKFDLPDLPDTSVKTVWDWTVDNLMINTDNMNSQFTLTDEQQMNINLSDLDASTGTCSVCSLDLQLMSKHECFDVKCPLYGGRSGMWVTGN